MKEREIKKKMEERIIAQSLKEHLENPPVQPELESNGPNPPVNTAKRKTKKQRKNIAKIKQHINEKKNKKIAHANRLIFKEEVSRPLKKSDIIEKVTPQQSSLEKKKNIRFGISNLKEELEDFQTKGELADNLRHIEADTNLIHGMYTNIFKKKILEAPMKKLIKKEKFKTYKSHNAKDEDEIVTVEKLRKKYGNK